MAGGRISELMEDHALERVPEAERKGWLTMSWNTMGLVTTLVMLYLGSLVCFVAGVKIALLAGVTALVIGSALAWGIARIAYVTGCSGTVLTRQYSLGVRGSALASIIFGTMVISFLAIENALLYRGILFFFQADDTLMLRVTMYGLFTLTWITLTAFGFELVARASSVMVIAFLIVLFWVVVEIVLASGRGLSEALLFSTQLPNTALQAMGINSSLDKYVFALNILIAPAGTLALNNADFGRYGRSTFDVGVAGTLAILLSTCVVMLIGGVLMYAGADTLTSYFVGQGQTQEAAQQRVLHSPDSIAATFMIFSGVLGFVLMFLAQGKAQVLNTYSSSLTLTNLFDALLGWRPGRFYFVVLANVIALLMLYGHILEYVEAWFTFLGVFMACLVGVIIVDYYFVAPRLRGISYAQESINYAGVITVIVSTVCAHYVLNDLIQVEFFTSLLGAMIMYPALRLTIFRPRDVP
jgi:cytosine permease